MKKYLLLFVVLLLTSSCQNMGGGRKNVEPGTQSDLEANVGDYVLFDLNSSTIDSNATYILNRQVEWLKKYNYINVVIEGHCDERGTREFNLALGARRANAVRQYLISCGISAGRIKTISYGKERPVVQGTGESVWKENRRAVTIVA